MNPQLGLFGSSENESSIELFFALVPDKAAAAAIALLAQQFHQKHRLTASISPERFHVSLHHIGTYLEVPDNVVALGRRAAESAGAGPFELTFDRALSFQAAANAPKPFVLGISQENANLTSFYQRLRKSLVLAGFGRCLKPTFTPHLTLLRDHTVIADQPIPPISWTAREFVLVSSEEGKGYTYQGSWPV